MSFRPPLPALHMGVRMARVITTSSGCCCVLYRNNISQCSSNHTNGVRESQRAYIKSSPLEVGVKWERTVERRWVAMAGKGDSL